MADLVEVVVEEVEVEVEAVVVVGEALKLGSDCTSGSGIQ